MSFVLDEGGDMSEENKAKIWRPISYCPSRYAEHYVWISGSGRLFAKYHADGGWEDTFGRAVFPTHWWDGPGIPDMGSPPQQNVVHFLSYKEFCGKLWLDLRGDTPVVVWGNDDACIRVGVSGATGREKLHFSVAPEYERARRAAYDIYRHERNRADPPPSQNPAPDWDKIKKLAQRMNGLVDEIEKEIGDGNDND